MDSTDTDEPPTSADLHGNDTDAARRGRMQLAIAEAELARGAMQSAA